MICERTMFTITVLGVLMGCAPKWETVETADGFNLIKNKNGAILGYSPKSGVNIIEKDGYAFKDLSKNSELDPYED